MTTLQRGPTMTEEEEMQGYCCWAICAEYMLFFLLFVLVLFTGVAEGAAASVGLQPCDSDVADVGG